MQLYSEYSQFFAGLSLPWRPSFLPSAPGQSPLHSPGLSTSSPSLAPVLALPVPLCPLAVFPSGPLLPLFLFGRSVAVLECPLHVQVTPGASLAAASLVPPIPVSPHLPTSSPWARAFLVVLQLLLGFSYPLPQCPPRASPFKLARRSRAGA